MKIKKRCFRLFSVLVICMVFVSVFCPVAFAYKYSDGGFLVEPTDILFSDLTSSDGPLGVVWSDSIFPPNFYEYIEDVSSVLVWFGDYSFNCKVIPANASSETITAYLVGNPALSYPDVPSTSEDFLLIFDVNNRSNFIVYISDGLYSTLISSEQDRFTFAMQPITEPDFAGSVSAGLYNTTHWVGQVVSSLISPDGALSGLLPLLAIFVAIPALVIGIKVIRSIIWGA